VASIGIRFHLHKDVSGRSFPVYLKYLCSFLHCERKNTSAGYKWQCSLVGINDAAYKVKVATSLLKNILNLGEY
jgi:hypothetical protein